MKIKFWEKTVPIKQEGRVLVVPEDKRFEFLSLLDDYEDNKMEKRRRRYKFWKFVNDILPETKNGKRWAIDTSEATVPKIIEEL